MNSDLSDIASALTASLARDGQGGMTAVLPLNTAGFSYTSDTNTGMYRTGSDAQAIKCGGTDIVAVTTAGASVTGSLSATGAVKQNGFNLLPIGLGPLPWSGTSAPDGWVLAYGQSLSRTTYADLWAFAQAEIALGNFLYGNGDGTTTFTIADMRGRIPGGKDNMGGTAANRLTSTTIAPSGSILGGVGGAQILTLLQANLPSVQLSVTGSFSGGTSFQPLISSGNGAPADAGPGVSGNPATMTVAGAITGTTSYLGSGTAFDKTQPTIITNYIIFAGV